MIPYTTHEGLIKIKVDAANDLWIAVEKEFLKEGISWFIHRKGKKGDHSFKAIPNLVEGVMEIRKVIK